jgi:hypothetical protein
VLEGRTAGLFLLSPEFWSLGEISSAPHRPGTPILFRHVVASAGRLNALLWREVPPNYSFSGFFSGVLVGAVEDGFAPVSFGDAGFSAVVAVAGDSFFAASLYESLR